MRRGVAKQKSEHNEPPAPWGIELPLGLNQLLCFSRRRRLLERAGLCHIAANLAAPVPGALQTFVATAVLSVERGCDDNAHSDQETDSLGLLVQVCWPLSMHEAMRAQRKPFDGAQRAAPPHESLPRTNRKTYDARRTPFRCIPETSCQATTESAGPRQNATC